MKMRRCIDCTHPIATACMRLGPVEGCMRSCKEWTLSTCRSAGRVLLLVHVLMRLRRWTSIPVASASLSVCNVYMHVGI